MKQEPGKRIVSKGKYIANVSIKAAGASLGTVIFLIGCLLTLLTCFFATRVLLNMHVFLRSLTFLSQHLCLIGILGSGAIVLLYLGAKIIKRAKETELGIPLTHTNTARLPLPDSLVRASQEPLQAQQSILLRAARETTQGQEEQLLRASTGE